ncbi:Holliday junction branch migration protein RuvA [Halodesulfovibrio sp. MK-HDV]|jgi:holliday junction DNA helicase RuvA|uniref:Holliday junction branch migration protein RuvA n=1 Tax=unclassified Halodesulfovibrio TaxID=2644657 RepID=UPI001370241C|nr:Holliday junction branch migration protein RuvA [Halodesulfovibrio sp. MK-HDV]KAF1075538.1 Holliday junction ATP-dependent DNA helicase RuvA [Halodesulfovibrio sp. MK-HDV]
MIAYLEGKIAEVTEQSVIIVTEGGVGYEVRLPAHTMSRVPAKGGDIAVFAYTVVREDALELYGFESWDERQMYTTLISISKVGGKTALGVLSVYRPDDLRRIVFEEDINALTQVSGIGKKGAQHIFLELKYKLKVDEMPVVSGKGDAPATSVYRDALDGLANLGYGEDEAAPLLKTILKNEPDLDVGSALRSALKALAKG